MVMIVGASTYYFLTGSNSRKESSLISDEVSNESLDKTGTRDYSSENLEINIRVPDESEVKEMFTNISIAINGGEVLINRTGTNYPDIKGYFLDLKTKNRLNPKTYNELIINERDSVLATLEDPNDEANEQRSYFVYVNGWVYTFSTSEQKLNPILDEIVYSSKFAQ
jgi:hypothetical protein